MEEQVPCLRTSSEITDALEEIGVELGIDGRASIGIYLPNARTAAQENQVGATFEFPDGRQHSFAFWIDPRTVDQS